MKVSASAKLQATFVKAGKQNFNNVPTRYQEQVRYILESEGYIINEDGTVTKIKAEQLK